MSASPYVPTIIISEDPGVAERGFSIEGREFVIKYPHAIKDEAEYTDGTKIQCNYYVIDLKEYVRVVPEARTQNLKFTDEILIPTMYATMSFKPCYIK